MKGLIRILELNKIYNEDCLDGLKKLNDNSIDLIITSPPYNLGKQHHVLPLIDINNSKKIS